MPNAYVSGSKFSRLGLADDPEGSNLRIIAHVNLDIRFMRAVKIVIRYNLSSAQTAL